MFDYLHRNTFFIYIFAFLDLGNFIVIQDIIKDNYVSWGVYIFFITSFRLSSLLNKINNQNPSSSW